VILKTLEVSMYVILPECVPEVYTCTYCADNEYHCVMAFYAFLLTGTLMTMSQNLSRCMMVCFFACKNSQKQ
jgi:hypothetical protein